MLHQLISLKSTINEGFDLLNSFRQEADVLRGDTDALMTMLMDKVEEVLVDVQPEIYADYKQLKHDIKEQRLERSLLLKTIEHL